MTKTFAVHATPHYFAGGGKMGARMRDYDWSSTPLGPPVTWPQSLSTVVNLLLTSSFPMFAVWGPKLTFLYNDSYRPILGGKPEALGRPSAEVWADIWDELAPLVQRALAGEATFHEDRLLVMERHGYREETYFTFSYNPIRDETGSVAGMFCACTENTARVLAERRLTFQLDLAERLRGLADPVAVTVAAAEALGRHLGVARAGYGRIDAAETTVAVDRDWSSGSMASLAGEARLLNSFGAEVINDLRAGRILRVHDVVNDPRTAAPGPAAGFASIGTRSLLVVPLVKAGRLMAILYLHEPMPRRWTDADEALAEDVAERTWAAIERIHAEAALRAANWALKEERAAVEAANARLTAEGERLRELFHQAPGFMCVLRGPDHVFDMANNAYLQLIGRRDLIGKPTREALPEVEGQGFFELLDQVYATGEPYIGRSLPIKFQRSPGEVLEERFITFVYQPIRDGNGHVTGLFVEGSDVTEARHAEEALRERTHALEIVNRTGAAIVAELDTERLVQTVTDAGVALAGAEFGAFFYKNVDDQGGSYMLYALSGAPREAFAAFPMPRATAVFGPTFNGEGIMRSDDITKDPRYGRNSPNYGMPTGHLPVRSYLAVPVRLRSGEVIGGLFFGHPEPGRFTERSESSLASLAAQAAVAMDNARLFQAAQREIRHRSRAEEQLRALNEQLEERVAEAIAEQRQAEATLRQVQKMDAVGQLTGGVAHDFNNLLQAMSGCLTLISRRTREPAVEPIIEAGRQAVDRGTKLVQQLMAFARRESLRPEPVDIRDRVLGMSELLTRALRADIRLVTKFGPGLWPIEVDPTQFELALINLAVNARDAMPEGGSLTLEASNVYLHEGDASALRGDFIKLSVSDTGCGMPADVQTRAFEPFFTTKEVGKGTGLGLSQVYGLARQAGGTAWIESMQKRGTIVHILLRRSAKAPAAEMKRSSPEVSNSRRHGSVLVVEDDPIVAMTVATALEDAGFAVTRAATADEALSVIAAGGVDLLFSDVVMPGGMSGVDLMREVQLRYPGLPVVLATGYSEEVARAPGAQVLSKPYRIDQLVGVLDKVLAEAERKSKTA
jgi:signal transduction histidine kinase/PAS domain-containing protein/ActR/RegA family two-component response regulator